MIVARWISLAAASLLVATASRAEGKWPEADQNQILGACMSGAKADAEMCACSLAATMKRWPRVEVFQKEFETKEGGLEFTFLLRECKVTIQIRAELAQLLLAKLGAEWAEMDPSSRETLAKNGYGVDRGFARAKSGRTKGVAMATLRIPSEIVGRESFLKSMSALDPGAFCAKSRSPTKGAKSDGAFDQWTLTYWCETTTESPQLGRVTSIYVWQFFRNRLVILDATIQPDEVPIAYAEAQRAIRLAVDRLAGDATKTAPLPVLTPAELFARASPGVGYVIVGEKFGSVVAVSKNRVVTNWHVVRGTTGDSLPTVHVGILESEAVLVGADEEQDLAVLQLLRGELPAISPRWVSLPAVGERVFTIGSPQGLENTLAEGLVSSVRTIKERPLLQISAAISLGSSGGGLFDDRGRLIGITTATIEKGQQLNFAVPSAALEHLLGDLFAHPAVGQNLGLLPGDVLRAMRASLSAPESERLDQTARVGSRTDAGTSLKEADEPTIDEQLFGCVVRSELDCTQRKLEAGADPNVSLFGNPVLYTAASGEDPRIVRVLVRAGARIDERTAIAGRTALHEAVIKGRTESVRVLLELGANKTITTHHGRTPLDFALHPPAPLEVPPNSAEIAKLLRGERPPPSTRLDPDYRWRESDRESLREIAGQVHDRMAARVGIAPDERALFITCFEEGILRRFPAGPAELKAARSDGGAVGGGPIGAVSAQCSTRWREPIESSTAWSFSAEALYRLQCEQSIWKTLTRQGVEPPELCGCLAKSARTAFPVPSELWKLERTEAAYQTEAQRQAVQRMIKPCLELMKQQ